MKNSHSKYFSVIEVCQTIGLDERTVVHYVEEEWIRPVPSVSAVSDRLLDEEDLARIRLIRELQEDLGIQDEAVSVILHLIDQIHCLRNQVIEGGERTPNELDP